MSPAIPTLTAEQMREVDRIMIEELGIELIQMMENAGRNLAELALSRFLPTSAWVLVGSGGNGGGGLVAARYLANRGVATTVALSRSELSGVPRHQLEILERMGITFGESADSDLVIDALIGYSLKGDPRGRTAELIARANSSAAPVLSLDTPSGLDVTTGDARNPVVWADATMTLALPKTGLLDAPQVGELYLADISVPPSVYGRLGLAVGSLFTDRSVIALRESGGG